ncbi:response regulator transcription factor [Candidatus Peregrinibacteria bacterium]|nr:response regulator transcription factor [Candidatus Peregrinibacteria bacterium]
MHILLVSPRERITKLLQKTLQYENITADIAETEKEVELQILKRNYDAIVIKDTPGVIQAIRVCRAIRVHFVEVALIVYDPQFTLEKQKFHFECGATAILTPPLSIPSLINALKQIFQKKHTEKHTETQLLKNKHIALNLETRQVTRAHIKRFLRNKEFVLLEYFMRNPGKILNRNTILESVWDHNINILTNTVDVHVSNLRRKIDTGFKKKIIETIHCVGYRMTDD